MEIEIGTSRIKYRNLTVGHVYRASIFNGSAAVYRLPSNIGTCHLTNKKFKKNTELIFFIYESLRLLIH
jgi:hypothetical protein